jgi:hypothetical protein
MLHFVCAAFWHVVHELRCMLPLLPPVPSGLEAGKLPTVACCGCVLFDCSVFARCV